MTDDKRHADRRDKFSRYLAVAMAVAVIAVAGWGAAQRLAEVAPGRDISIVLPVTAEQSEWFFGQITGVTEENGGIGVSIASTTFPFANPTPARLVALWADPIARFLEVTAGAIVAATFLQRLARAKTLEEGTARLVFAGTGILAAR